MSKCILGVDPANGEDFTVIRWVACGHFSSDDCPYCRIAELEGLIADLQCSGGFCGLSNELCDNCRIRFKALGEAK